MTKYMLASATALALLIAPAAVMAQGAGDAGSSQQMKGPPNADGMQKSDMKKGDTDMTSGRSDSTKGTDSNGAAAAKATGAEKQ